MRIVEQLAVFIANKPGTLAEVCDALAAERVNIYGLTVSDTVDHAVVRLVVSDTRKALAIFETRGTLVLETEVLMFENDNRPGSLSRIAAALSKAKINIEYAYLASMPSARKGLLIVRVADPKKALKVLQSAKLFENE
ncbi:ACT domain-containing protein [Spartobacteria bacterium LR76]|uniref:ACT domain-containing protein n=1 Tax=Terrimicrobium sacchariphilum TaxID=690879 RepID=UPI0009465FDF|nr:ACT domain-containing protein [Terrimicrobium sacchariphilum]PTX95434.1 ACT domain-containing protein [Spartobacteria bacterium LR76]